MALAVLWICGGPAAANPPDDPLMLDTSVRNIDTTDSLFFSTRTGWFLRIFSDGSGDLQFGSSAGDNARFPAGAFDFANAMSSLKSQSVLGSDDRSIAVTAQLREKINVPQTVSKELGLRIFQQAAGAAKSFDAKRFEELKRDRPFVAGKTP